MLFKVTQFCLICLLVLENEAKDENVIRPLPAPLEPPMFVEVKADITNWGSKFYVYFQEGTDKPDGDVYFHISVRYGANELAFNRWINETWEEEEVHRGLPERNGRYRGIDLGRFTFTEGYTLQITPRDDDFLINLNGREYAFKYRVKKDLEKAKFVVVNGDVDVRSLLIQKAFKEPGYQIRYESY